MPETKALTLYDIEADIAALAELEDGVQTEEERQLVLSMLSDLTEKGIAKREGLIRAVRGYEGQIAFLKEEEQRLKAARVAAEQRKERLENYAASLVVQFGQKMAGKKNPCLQAKTGVLTVRKSPDSVVLVEESEIPVRFVSRVTVELDGELWRAAVAAAQGEIQIQAEDLDSIFTAIENGVRAFDKRAIKAAIDTRSALIEAKRRAGEEITDQDLASAVPGADINLGVDKLVIA